MQEGLPSLAALSAVPWENVFHIGVVVDDLERGMREVAEQFGITFAEQWPVSVTLEGRDGLNAPATVMVAYGTSGPPYLELLQATGDRAWAPGAGPRFHHLGVWSENPVAEVERLERLGMVREYTGRRDGRFAFAYLTTKHGIRVEIIDAAGRVGLVERLRRA